MPSNQQYKPFFAAFYLFAILAIMLAITPFQSASAANPVHEDLLKWADPKVGGAYVRERFLKIMKKPFDAKDKKKLLIIGDSHAQDFLNSMAENDYLKNYQTSTRYIPTRCQLFLGDNARQFIDSKDKVFCEEADSLQKAKQQISQADVIILAANWKEWSARILPQTIKGLALNKQQTLLIVGRKSFGKVSIRSYLRMPQEKLLSLRNTVDLPQMKINEIMQSNLDTGIFINIHQELCGEQDTCPVFTPDRHLISFDGGHLTQAGALYTGQILFKNTRLGSL